MWTVVADRDFTAAQGARVFSFCEGEVVEGSLAEYLYATGAPVSGVTDLEPDQLEQPVSPEQTKTIGRRPSRAAAGKRR